MQVKERNKARHVPDFRTKGHVTGDGIANYIHRVHIRGMTPVGGRCGKGLRSETCSSVRQLPHGVARGPVREFTG